MTGRARRYQADQRPGGLRGGARSALVTVVGELIAAAILAPAAVGILDGDEPVDRLAHDRRSGVESGDVEAAQHRPRAVDVIHAPAAVPTAVCELGAAKIVECAVQSRVRFRPLAQLR